MERRNHADPEAGCACQTTEADKMEFTQDPERLFEAARLLANCRSYAYPALHKLLTAAGFDLGPMRIDRHDHDPERGNCPPREEFPSWFTEEMAKRNYSCKDAANALNTSKMNIYRWRNGSAYPQRRCMRIILEVFDPDRINY